MSSVDRVIRGNEAWSRSFDRGDLRAPPRLRAAVVTCMDCRLDPLRALGLDLGDAHVIRNAGAVVTDDVLRSLVISHWELGTVEALVVGHTACGMTAFTNETLRRKLGSSGLDATLDFLPFRDVEENVRAGVGRILASPLLPAPYAAHGFVYDVATGGLTPLA